MSPGRRPSGIFDNSGKKTPIKNIIDPVIIRIFCIIVDYKLI